MTSQTRVPQSSSMRNASSLSLAASLGVGGCGSGGLGRGLRAPCAGFDVIQPQRTAADMVNHPGVSGDSICWESWGHGKIIEELSV
jgi:hypothetical protein